MIRVRFEGWELKAEGWGLRNDWKIKILNVNVYDWRISLKLRGREWYEWFEIKVWELGLEDWWLRNGW